MRRLQLLLLLVVVLLVIITSSHIAEAQPRSFELLHQAGRGTILNVMWRPAGDTILAATATVAWIYTADLRDVGHIDGLELAAYSPRGRYISGVDQDNIVQLHDADSLRPIFALNTTRTQVISLIWSPKGDLLAELSTDGTLRVWNIVSRSLAFTSHSAHFTSIAWSKAGTYLAASSFNLWLWTSTTFEQISPKPDESDSDTSTSSWINYGTLNWHGDRFLSVLVIGGDWDRIDRWDVDQRESIGEDYDTKFGSEADCYEACSRDYQSVVISDFKDVPLSIQTKNSRATVSEIALENSTKFVAAWKANDLTVAVGAMTGASNTTGSGTITLVDLIAGKPVRQIKAHRGELRFLLWNDDQERLISVGEDGYLRTWQTVDGQMLGETNAHGTFTSTIAWSPDHRLLAVVDADNNVHLWDAETWSEVKALSNVRHNAIHDLHWQTHGYLLAIHYTRPLRADRDEKIGDGIVEIWDTKPDAPRLIATISESQEISEIAWNNEGTKLAIVGEERRLNIWDSASQRLVVHTDIPIVPNSDEDSFTVGAKWSPNDDLIAISIGPKYDSSAYWLVNTADGMAVMFIDRLKDKEYGEQYGGNDENAYSWMPNGLFVHTGWYTVCLGGPCYWDGAVVEIVNPLEKRSTKYVIGALSDQVQREQDAYFDYAEYAFSPNGEFLTRIAVVVRGNDVEQKREVLMRGTTLWELPTDDHPQFTERFSTPQFGQIVWDPNSTVFLAGTDIIDAMNGRTITRLEPERRYWTDYIWSADSDRIAEVSAGVLYIWGR